MKRHTFGEFLKEKRIGQSLTLREFCLKHHLDPGNMSKIERGILPPPQDHKKLEQWAEWLKIKKGSDDWLDFFDIATVEAGRIPKELMDDKEILERLPLLFRTIKGKKLSGKKLKQLIMMVKAA